MPNDIFKIRMLCNNPIIIENTSKYINNQKYHF